jgi:hypothetical protein
MHDTVHYDKLTVAQPVKFPVVEHAHPDLSSRLSTMLVFFQIYFRI